ncbi:MAG TPA: SRPBCC domain-containing protein [Bdellovibrio sp.]
MKNDNVQESIKIYASPAEVWGALTDSDELENWWSEDVTLEPKKGGKFREAWLDDAGGKQLASGEVIAVKAKQEITFTWKEKNWDKSQQTQCTITINEDGKHSVVTVTHEGWNTFTDEKKKKKTMSDFSVGWKYHLQELKSYLED